MTTIAITGAAGKTGRVVCRDFLEHGYDIRPIDSEGRPGRYGDLAGDLGVGLFRADLTDFGQTLESVADCDAIVHLAAIPAPGLRPDSTTFLDNTAMNYNIFAAAQRLDIARVVWASSETTFGLPFDVPPRYAPIDEDHYPLPTSTYALSKVVGETMATHFAESTGAHSFIVAAADTLMAAANADLLADQFPGLELTRPVTDHETLLSIDKARTMLGYAPQYSWRDR